MKQRWEPIAKTTLIARAEENTLVKSRWAVMTTCTRFFKKKYDKTNKMACAPSEDSDQSDQSVRSLHEETLGI